MESSLHRALKESYCEGDAARSEVAVDGFRIDAIDQAGRLIEVQSAALSALRAKLIKLLPDHRVRVVKPWILGRKVVRRNKLQGPDLSARWSPKRSELLDVFDEWIALARIFPDPNLSVEVIGVTVSEIRGRKGRGWKREQVFDRVLIERGAGLLIEKPNDLWQLIPDPPPPGEAFTTVDLAQRLRRPLAFAQRVAYCLRHAGAVTDLGKTSRHRLYARSSLINGPLTLEAAYESAGEVPARR